jgi:hypothetical protein
MLKPGFAPGYAAFTDSAVVLREFAVLRVLPEEPCPGPGFRLFRGVVLSGGVEVVYQILEDLLVVVVNHEGSPVVCGAHLRWGQ